MASGTDVRDMDPIYLLTGLITVAGAIAGLVLICYHEKRSLAARRIGPSPVSAEQADPDSLPS